MFFFFSRQHIIYIPISVIALILPHRDSAVFLPFAIWRVAVGRRSKAPAEPQQLENQPPDASRMVVVGGGRWLVVVGRWLVVAGGWLVGGGRWSVVGGRWLVVVGGW